MPARLMRATKVVGAKQTIKALDDHVVKAVYIAKDADNKVVQPVIDKCKRLNVELVYLNTKAELGRACGIDVGAAVASIIE